MCRPVTLFVNLEASYLFHVTRACSTVIGAGIRA